MGNGDVDEPQLAVRMGIAVERKHTPELQRARRHLVVHVLSIP